MPVMTAVFICLYPVCFFDWPWVVKGPHHQNPVSNGKVFVSNPNTNSDRYVLVLSGKVHMRLAKSLNTKPNIVKVTGEAFRLKKD